MGNTPKYKGILHFKLELSRSPEPSSRAQAIAEVFADITICNYYGAASFGGLETYGCKRTLNATHAYSQFNAEGTLDFLFHREVVVP